MESAYGIIVLCLMIFTLHKITRISAIRWFECCAISGVSYTVLDAFSKPILSDKTWVVTLIDANRHDAINQRPSWLLHLDRRLAR